MADAMQGIMSLPPEMGGMDQGPRSFFTPQDEATLSQLRSSISPREFSDEMFSAAEQVDPQAVAELRMTLQGLQLPANLVDLLKQVIDRILAEPERYQEIRQQLLAEGVPEDLFPPEFDPNYFAALNMALDQVSGPPVQGFAGGGMAMTPIAGGIASLGRRGDTMLAHITPQEAMMLRRAGGAGSINPVTGLPEFWNLFKEIGKGFRSIGRAISGAVRGVVRGVKNFIKSDIGRMVTAVALGFFLGPAAASFLGVSSAAGVAAVSGFIGGAGSTLLAGGNLRDALKAGAIGGILGGLGQGISGGTQAFQAGSYTGPTTIAGQYNKFAQSVADASRSLTGGAAQIRLPGSDVQPMVSLADEAVTPVASLDEMAAAPGGAQPSPMAAVDDKGFTQLTSEQASRVYADPRYNPALSANAQYDKLFGQPIVPTGTGMAGTPPASAPTFTGMAGPQAPVTSMPGVGPAAPPASMQSAASTTGQYYGLRPEGGGVGLRVPGGGTPQLNAMAETGVGTAVGAGAGATPSSKGIMELLREGEFTQAGKQAWNQYLSPEGIQSRGMSEAVGKVQGMFPGVTPEQILSAPVGSPLNIAFQNAMPGMMSTYGPLAATALGATYLAGGFDVPETPKPDIPISGAELYRRNPYLITPKIRTISASTGMPYRGYAAGGIASLAGGTQHFPRKNGPIDGPGTGTSDSIPAMLSDGEFVFTAKAVRAMGKGSRRKGAKRMYALMKALEKRA